MATTEAAPRAVRAAEVLPPGLVRALQNYVEAVYVYVPARVTCDRQERDAEIMRQRAEGRSIVETAAAFGISARRLLQIQKRSRQQSNSGAGEAP